MKQSFSVLWLSGSLGLLCAQGCEGAGEEPELRPEVGLIDAEAWEVVEASEDPASDRPEEVVCPEEGWSLETIGGEPSLEVDTSLCNYIAMVQPLLHDLVVGDRVTGRIWHQYLSATEEAEAHLAYFLAGELVWEEWVPIPMDAGIVLPDFEIDVDAPAGTPLGLHLHNHGFNTWNVIDLNREAESNE
ncbi:MAG: hypothetical protein VX519_04970 [Myxococcota bacterium]|nr:hypothetical protein [Myxococcota bacterium]